MKYIHLSDLHLGKRVNEFSMIEDQKYILKSGEAVLVFPLQPHSYTCIEDGNIQMSIFSPEMVSSFYKKNKSRIWVPVP